MPPEPARILVVDGDVERFQALQQRLSGSAAAFTVVQTMTPAAFDAAMTGGEWDLIVAAQGVVGLGFDTLLGSLGARLGELPVILLVEDLTEEEAEAYLQRGVRAWLWVDRLAGIRGLVTRCLDEAARRRDQQEVRRALVAKEELLEGVFQSVASHIAVLDQDGCIVAVNAAWQAFTAGNSPSSSSAKPGAKSRCGVGTNYLEVCRNSASHGAEEAAAVYEGLKTVLEGRAATFSVEYPCHAPHERRWFELVATPLSHGRRGVVVAHTNITGRKLAEHELRRRLELQDQLAMVAATVPGLVCTFRQTPEGAMSMPFATPATQDLYGVSPETVREDFSPVFERIHSQDQERLREGILESARTMLPWRDSFRILHPQKGERWLEGHSVPRREPDGSILWHGFVQDVTERKRLERERESAFLKYRTLFESFPLGITVADRTGRILESNRKASELLGISEVEHYGRSIDGPQWKIVRSDGSLMPPEEFASVRALREGCLVENVEMGLVKAPDHTVWISVTAAPVGFPDMGVVITYGDISDRRRAEERLRASENRFRALIENAPDGVVLISPRGVMTYASPAACRMFGYDASRVQEIDPNAATHPEDLPRVMGALEALLRDPSESKTLKYRFRHSDGHWIWIESTFTNLAGLPGVESIVINFRNIDDRKRAEDALAFELTRRRILIEGSRDGIVVLDEGGRLFEANRRFGEMLGYEMEELKNLSVWDWDPQWTREQVLEAIRTLGPEGAHFETRHRRKNGTLFDVELSNSAAVLGGQKTVFCVCRDITERKRAEARMAQDRRGTEFLLEIHQRAPLLSDRELYDYVLERAVQLTESTIGFFHQVSEDQRDILLTTWNQEALQNCTAAYETHYPVDVAGNWVDCIREQRPVVYNDYARSPHQRGLPKGHAELRRFMSIPVVREDKVRIIFGVGNKPTDYNDDDVAQLQMVANELHKLMTQRLIQHQLHQLSEAVEQSPVGIFIANAEGVIEYVNRRFVETAGYGLSEMNQGFLARWLAETRDLDEDQVREAMAGVFRGVGWTGELRTRRKDGAHQWEFLTLSPISDAKGVVTHLLGIREDISERKRAVEALRVSEERYRSLVETSSDWIWEVDRDGRYTYASPRIHEILGYAPEEVLGRTPFDFMPEDDAARVKDLFGAAVREGRGFSGLENTNCHKDGHLVVLETSGVPLFDTGGRLAGFRGMDRDVTSRRHLEVQLRQSQKLDAVGQLAGGVAHDFNNILAAILMNFELLREDSNLSAASRESLKELEADARRAAGVTRQLLMFSRQSVLDIRVLNLNEVVENLLRMLRRLIGEQVTLAFNPAHQAPAVEADPGMLEQVLLNLVVNARDAMPRGGCVTISTNLETLDSIQASQNPDRRAGGFACLTVADTGLGMDATTLRRIFDPFFTTKESGKGTGLGLATVHGIVGQHKGWIEVESQLGHGTAFRVYLPASSGVPQTAAKSEESGLRRYNASETLLIVEDESAVRRSLRQILRMMGYQVLEAANGHEALQVWSSEREKIALVMTDMVMPGEMTGLELADRLLRDKPELRVIVSSGYSTEISRLGLPVESRITYLAKPYNVGKLGDLLRVILGSGKGPA
ncbi:MAG: PAS domain S-box protein [Verrucomicrobiales bacterium]|nr:PAS domain S-box protein [Verrucomicrobiales bacterium]